MSESNNGKYIRRCSTFLFPTEEEYIKQKGLIPEYSYNNKPNVSKQGMKPVVCISCNLLVAYNSVGRHLQSQRHQQSNVTSIDDAWCISIEYNK